MHALLIHQLIGSKGGLLRGVLVGEKGVCVGGKGRERGMGDAGHDGADLTP